MRTHALESECDFIERVNHVVELEPDELKCFVRSDEDDVSHLEAAREKA